MEERYPPVVARPADAAAFARCTRVGDRLSRILVVPELSTSQPTRAHRSWRWLTGDDHLRWPTVAGWLLLVALSLVAVVATLTWDHREVPTTGDENTYILMAISLAGDGHNLSFDTADAAAWRDIGLPFAPDPFAFFFKATDDNYIAAKPFGYPLFIAPFIAATDLPTGLAVGNALLLVGLVAVAVAILRTTLSGPAVPLLGAAFIFGGATYLYTYAASVELFYALVVGVATLGMVRWWQQRATSWAVIAFAATGFVAAERPPLGLALAVPGVVVLWSMPSWRRRLAVGGVAIVALAAVVAPWLYYTGGETWSPYTAPRFFAATPVFETQSAREFLDGVDVDRLNPGGSSVFAPSGMTERLTRDLDRLAPNTLYALVGRHTGLVVWAPLAVAALGTALWRFRRLDAMGRACTLAILGYLVLYLLLFTQNFFGGAHSLGNRYFIHASPLVLGVIAYVGWRARTAVTVAVVSLAWSLVVLWPHHTNPRTAYLRIDRTSVVQELFPFGSDTSAWQEFRCAAAYGVTLDCDDDG